METNIGSILKAAVSKPCLNVPGDFDEDAFADAIGDAVFLRNATDSAKTAAVLDNQIAIVIGSSCLSLRALMYSKASIMAMNDIGAAIRIAAFACVSWSRSERCQKQMEDFIEMIGFAADADNFPYSDEDKKMFHLLLVGIA